jgi:lysophospholipase L1-like esterase
VSYLLALLGFVVGVVALSIGAEFVARLWIRRGKRYYVWRPGLRVEYRPDPAVLPDLEPLVRFEINREGERGSDLLQAGSLFRVLVAGGSAAECVFIDQPSSWPSVLQRLLMEPSRRHLLGASRVHVGNIARSGIDSQALVRVLEKVLPFYESLDLIAIMVGGSDVNEWLARGTPESFQPEPVRSSDFFDCHPDRLLAWRRSDLALTEMGRQLWRGQLRVVQRKDRAGRWLGRARAMRAAAREVRHTCPDATAMLDNFDANLRQCLATAKRGAKRVLLVRQPCFRKDEYSPEEISHFWSGAVGRPWNEEVTVFYSEQVVGGLMDLLDQRAVEVADILEVEHLGLSKVVEPSLKSYYDFFHFTSVGAAVVAEAVANAIVSDRAREGAGPELVTRAGLLGSNVNRTSR